MKTTFAIVRESRMNQIFRWMAPIGVLIIFVAIVLTPGLIA